MTLRPEDLIAAIRYLLLLRADAPLRRDRRHRPPGQPPPADHRRAGLGRAPQGVPQAPPHGAGADEPQGCGGHDAPQPGQSQEHLGGDRVFLRPRRAVAGGRPDQPAVDAHARAAVVGLGSRRVEPQAGRLRGPRRAHFALRPHLPHRDPRRHEHRPDLQPGDLRRGGRVRFPGHALPGGQEGQADRRHQVAAGGRGVTRPTWRRPIRPSRTTRSWARTSSPAIAATS